jgi:hypothetical protein
VSPISIDIGKQLVGIDILPATSCRVEEFQIFRRLALAFAL